MDNEAIVDQIVRSLSFEVIAGPQHVKQFDSTSESTPLNVKIRVRKKHGAELRHGILSMPKVDVMNDSRKNPERMRLVSSDQTIMNFNVLMEAEFDKSRQKQNININTTDIEVNDKNPIRKNLNNTAPNISKKNKDIFGRCKPGGCLDPPFGEDKYSYLPTQQNLSLPLKDDAVKLRSSSIFKNNIFKRKKKTSLSYDELNVSASKINTIDKGSLEVSSPYSSSIITYPPQPESIELEKLEEKKMIREDEQSYRTRYSIDEKSKTSSVDEGGYYMIPKKTKKLSIQNDINKIQRKVSKSSENKSNSINITEEINLENKNLLNAKTSTEKFRENTINKAHSFIPIPLPVPVGAVTNSKPTSNNIFPRNSKVQDISSSNISQATIKNNEQVEIISINEEYNLLMEQRDVKLSKSETLHYEDKCPDIEKSTSMEKNYTQFIENKQTLNAPTKVFVNEKRQHSNISLSNDKHSFAELINIQKLRSSEVDNYKTLSVLKDRLENADPDDIMNNRYSLTDRTDLKSHPLLADAREKSVLDVTKDVSDQVKENTIQSQGYILNLTKYEENYKNDSPPDLNQIWENETDLITSNVDFITSTIMHKPKEYVSQQGHQVLHETISEINLQADIVTPSIAHVIKSSTEITLKIDTDNTEEILINNFHIGDIRSPDAVTEISQEKPISSNDDTEMRDSKTYYEVITENNQTQNKLYDNFKKIHSNDKIFKHSKFDQNTLDESKRNTNQQTNKFEGSNVMEALGSKHPSDCIDNVNDNTFVKSNENSIKNKINEVNNTHDMFPSVSADDNFTTRDLFPISTKQSVSNRSEVGSGRFINTLVDTSSKQDGKYLKMTSSDDFGKISENLQNKESNMIVKLNDISQEQKPQIKYQSEKTNDTCEQILGSHQIHLKNLPIDLSKSTHMSQPASIPQQDTVPWKIDIALQSFVDENNERIIKSLDSKNIPEQHLNDAFLVAKCYLGNEMNEIKIPIDQDNDLSVKVVNVKPQHRTLVSFDDYVNSSDTLRVKTKNKSDVTVKPGVQSHTNVYESSDISEEYEKKKIKIDVPVSGSNITQKDSNYKNFNEVETNTYKKAITSGDVRNALTSIYEEELVPLQGIIKELREEIDTLVVNQMKLKVQHFPPNRAKLLKLVNAHRKCSCLRKQ